MLHLTKLINQVFEDLRKQCNASSPTPPGKYPRSLNEVMSTKDLQGFWNDKKLQRALVG